jgi:shikimate kinase
MVLDESRHLVCNAPEDDPATCGDAGISTLTALTPLNEAIRDKLRDRTLVFVGMMGSGKSAVGKIVADELGLAYRDSDAEIVAAAGMSIPEIFEKFGEEHFRAGEARVVSRLVSDGPAVISLGGGAFLSEETRAAIRQHGISVWLMADADLLLSRVLRRPKSRPLLQTADPRATLIELLEKRRPVYELADIHVESSRLSKRATGDSVLASVKAWLDNETSTDGNAHANGQG